MKKSILFLDIDGVLIPYNFNSLNNQFKEYCVKNLNEIINQINCEIVVSSDWRNCYTFEQLCSIFKLNGIKNPLDITSTLKTYDLEDLEYNRCEEIKIYMKDKECNYCVVDDMNLKWLDRKHFVRTNSDKGLTENLIECIIKKLSTDN